MAFGTGASGHLILILALAVSLAAPAAAARRLASAIGAWEQCGGESGGCGSHCIDGVWPGATCPSGFQCYRQSQWYWQCNTTPFGPSMMSTPAPVTHSNPATPAPVVTPVSTPSGLTAAQAAAVAVPTPVTFQTQYPVGNAQLAQIPLRYDPIAENMIRTGYVYLPSKYQNKALPVMVLFHGLEGYGLDTMQAGSGGSFVDMAEHYQHIIIAPDSRLDGPEGWQVSNADQPPTPDMLHTIACIDYVRSLPNVVFKTSAIIAAGVSNGGIMSAPIATRYSVFTHAMLFHSRGFVNQLGSQSKRIWMSTGIYDVDVSPAYVKNLAAQIKQAHNTWPAVTYNVNYKIPHDLADPYERIDAIHWWLHLGSWTRVATPAQLSAVANGQQIL